MVCASVADPTPAHVRGVARGQEGVKTWAAAVENAAFGPDDVDEGVEGRLKEEEP